MKEDKIVIYQTEDGQTQIDVCLEKESVWLKLHKCLCFLTEKSQILDVM